MLGPVTYPEDGDTAVQLLTAIEKGATTKEG
jgi:hypothetical protein